METEHNHGGAGDGRRYHIQIDEGRFDIESSTTTGQALLDLADKASCRYAIVQVIRDADDQFIDPGETVDLSAPGVERFVTVLKDEVTIFVRYNDEIIEVKVNRGKVPVGDIKKKSGVPDNFVLYELRSSGPVPLDDAASVEIEGCERFTSQQKKGESS